MIFYCMDKTCFVYLFVTDGHLDYFQLLTIVNIAAMHIHAQVSESLILFFWTYTLEYN